MQWIMAKQFIKINLKYLPIHTDFPLIFHVKQIGLMEKCLHTRRERIRELRTLLTPHDAVYSDNNNNETNTPFV